MTLTDVEKSSKMIGVVSSPHQIRSTGTPHAYFELS